MLDDRGPIHDTVRARNLSGEHVGAAVTVPAEEEQSWWAVRGQLYGVDHRRDDDRDSVLLTVLVGDFQQRVTVKIVPHTWVRIDTYERNQPREEVPLP
jgi:hypothetical protein